MVVGRCKTLSLEFLMYENWSKGILQSCVPDCKQILSTSPSLYHIKTSIVFFNNLTYQCQILLNIILKKAIMKKSKKQKILRLFFFRKRNWCTRRRSEDGNKIQMIKECGQMKWSNEGISSSIYM